MSRRMTLAVASLVAAVAINPSSEAAARRPMAVLTPATPEKLVVYAGDVFIPAQSLLDSKKDDKLQKLANASGFSVAPRLRAQVIEALRMAKWDAVEKDMTRLAVGGPSRREDYPADGDGRLMLDLKVQFVGLVAGWGRLSSYRPMVHASYRLLDDKGRPLSLPKAIYYCHASIHCAPNATPARMAAVDENAECAFASFATVENDAARVWQCLDVAFLRIGERLAADLDEAKL